MGKTAHRQNSFAAGEVSPSFYGNTGAKQYADGLRTCRNFIVNRYGSLERRVGFEHLAVLNESGGSGTVRPVRIHAFNNDESGYSYILQFQLNRIYIYSVLKSTGAVALISDPAGTGYDWIVTPYTTETEIWGLRFAQAGDSVLLGAGSIGDALKLLTRVSHSSWTFADYVGYASDTAPTWDTDNSHGGGADAWNAVAQSTAAVTDYQPKRWSWKIAGVKDGVESKPSAELWPNNVAEQVISLYENFTNPTGFFWDLFSASADTIRIYRGRNGIYGLVAEVAASETTFIDDGSEPDYTQQPRKQIAAADTPFYNRSTYGVAFFEQRLILANLSKVTDYRAMRIVGSATGRFTDFDDLYPIAPSHAFDFDLASTQYERIKHLVPLRRLIALTDSGEWYISGAADTPIGPLSFEARKQSYVGCNDVTPVVIDNRCIFVQREGKTVHAVGYSDVSDGLDAADLIWASRHLTDGKEIFDLAYQQTPDSIIWGILDDGTMLGMSFLPRYGVMAWHRHDTGDAYSFADTNPTVTGAAIESVCSVPAQGIDQVFVAVRRQDNPTAGARTRWMLERMTTQVKNSDSYLHNWLDAWAAFDYRNTTAASKITITGVTYLEGETGVAIEATGGHTPFVAGDVDDHIWFDPDGALGFGPVRVLITAVTDSDSAVGTLLDDVPVDLQAQASSDWGFARTEHAGYHLMGAAATLSGLVNGKPVSGLTSDGAGAVTTLHACVAVIGVPITSQIEQLELVGNAATRASKKTVSRVELEVDEVILPVSGTSSGIKVGDTLDDTLTTIGYDAEDADDRIEVTGEKASRKGGRFAVQCTDAIPLIIRSITRGVAVDGSNLV